MASCPICHKYFDKKKKVLIHMERAHVSDIPENMSTGKYYYSLNHNGETTGKCRICSNQTDYDEVTGRTKILCDNPKCKESFSKIAQERSLKKHGVAHYLQKGDQMHQMLMLSHRKISGEYTWSDGKTKVPYVGSYEHKFLQFLDLFLNFDPSTIYAPCPIVFKYEYEGQILQHSPDFYIDILDLIIEIKHGGDNPNNHPKIQAVDVAKDKAKEDAIKNTSTHNYIKIVNNDFNPFVQLLATLSDQRISGTKSDRIFIINESASDITDNSLVKSGDELYFVLYGDKELHDMKVGIMFSINPHEIITFDPESGFFNVVTGDDMNSIMESALLYKYIGKESLYSETQSIIKMINDKRGYIALSSLNAFALIYNEIFDRKNNFNMMDYVFNIYLAKEVKNDDIFYSTLNLLFTKNICLNEVSIVSTIDQDYKPEKSNINISNISLIKLDSESISKYKNSYTALSHIRISDEYFGFLLKYQNEIIGYVNVNIKTKTIQAMEIFKKYQGNNLSQYLLELATTKFNADNLSVNKKNILAKKIYEKYGFKTYKTTDTMIFMKLNSSKIESEGI